VVVTARADASFTIDFCFQFSIETLILKTFSFTVGARAEFTGGLTISATLEKIKNFKSLTAGATFRIPTVVAPGLTILLNPYVRLEGQAKFKVAAQVDFIRTIIMPRWTKTWSYGDSATKIKGASPSQAGFTIKSLREDVPYTATATANADLFITPVLGLQIGVSALDLFDLMGGPIVKVPLQFSVMASVASSYDTPALPACALALHFSLAVQAGITVEFKVLGISALSKEWLYTFRRSDTSATAENTMTEVVKKNQPTGELGESLAKLRKQKKAAEEQYHAQKVMRQLFSETGVDADLVLTDKEKQLYKTAFKVDAKSKVKYAKWQPLSSTIEAEATRLENEIFETQAKINELAIPALYKLRDDFVTRAAGLAVDKVPSDIKTSFEALTSSAWTAVSSDSARYKLISDKLKQMEAAWKAVTKSEDGIEKKLVFFSFCLLEVVKDGTKHKYVAPAWFKTPSVRDSNLIDDTFPKIETGKARYKNDDVFISGFLGAESRGEAVVGEDAEEDKAEKHGWEIVNKPRF